MKYQTRKKALILLADGTIFYGKAVGGKEGSAFGEVCFNTGMTGYQEIFTDPSYYGQLMVTTNAHIGNYGTNRDEVESEGIKIAGLICRNLSYQYSRPAADDSLEAFLNEHNLLAISDVDTRALVSYIRDNWAMNAVISTEVDNIEGLKKQLAEVPNMDGLELASKYLPKNPISSETKMRNTKFLLWILVSRKTFCVIFQKGIVTLRYSLLMLLLKTCSLLIPMAILSVTVLEIQHL